MLQLWDDGTLRERSGQDRQAKGKAETEARDTSKVRERWRRVRRRNGPVRMADTKKNRRVGDTKDLAAGHVERSDTTRRNADEESLVSMRKIV